MTVEPSKNKGTWQRRIEKYLAWKYPSVPVQERKKWAHNFVNSKNGGKK